MDTYINIDFRECMRCYQCIYLSMHKTDNSLGCFTIGYQGIPIYYDDYVDCHHCKLPINNDGEYDEFCEEVNYPCEKICPNKAIKIERW